MAYLADGYKYSSYYSILFGICTVVGGKILSVSEKNSIARGSGEKCDGILTDGVGPCIIKAEKRGR
jgi:hypothetical protein